MERLLYIFLRLIFASFSVSGGNNQSQKIKSSLLKNRWVKLWTSGSTGWSTPGGTVSSTHRHVVTFSFFHNTVSDYALACILYRKPRCANIYNKESMCMQITNVCTQENCHCKSAPVGLLKAHLRFVWGCLLNSRLVHSRSQFQTDCKLQIYISLLEI